ncbi:unnamed protein product [Effrenium voratum]|uniref:Uncharacterized protein n=1 Tax=Effrenium voratum TaxID=2562239 RepID=A0AA36J7N3_9DINO|nr:unnamed protein product [Effrenium voratum]
MARAVLAVCMLAAVACCLLRSSWAFIPGREPVRSDAAVAAAGAVVAASMPQHAEAFVYKGKEYFDVFYGIDPLAWASCGFAIVYFGAALKNAAQKYNKRTFRAWAFDSLFGKRETRTHCMVVEPAPKDLAATRKAALVLTINSRTLERTMPTTQMMSAERLQMVIITEEEIQALSRTPGQWMEEKKVRMGDIRGSGPEVLVELPGEHIHKTGEELTNLRKICYHTKGGMRTEPE